MNVFVLSNGDRSVEVSVKTDLMKDSDGDFTVLEVTGLTPELINKGLEIKKDVYNVSDLVEIASEYGLFLNKYENMPGDSDVKRTLITPFSSKSANAFISVWKTDNEGISEDNQIRLPIDVGDGNEIIVDWGDGYISTFGESSTYEDQVHTYDTPGIYEVTIVGTCKTWMGHSSNDQKDAKKLIEIKRWGMLTLGRISGTAVGFFAQHAFDLTAKDQPNINTDSFYSIFYEADCNLDGIGNWDVSNVTNMMYAFRYFNGSVDISDWDVSSVTNMSGMFQVSLSKGGVPLPVDIYDSMLIKWSQLDLQNGVSLYANDSQYSEAAASARDHIINTFEWTITDGGQVI